MLQWFDLLECSDGSLVIDAKVQLGSASAVRRTFPLPGAVWSRGNRHRAPWPMLAATGFVDDARERPVATRRGKVRADFGLRLAVSSPSRRDPPPLVTGRRIGSGPPEIQTLAARQAGVLRISTQRMRSSVSQAHRRAAFPTNLEWGPDSSKLKGRNSCPLSVYNFCFYLPGSAGNRTIS